MFPELHVRPEAPGEHDDRQPRLRIRSEGARPFRLLGDQLERERHRQLVRRDVGRKRRRLVVLSLHVGPVATDPHDDLVPGVVATDRDRADTSRIDERELIVGDE